MTDIAMLLRLSPSSGMPIYRQVMEQVKNLIASGQLNAGDSLPSVRQLAEHLQVNPMTISKAWSLLEAEGLLVRERGRGMLVAEQSRLNAAERLTPQMQRLVSSAEQLGLTLEQTQHLLRKVWQQEAGS